MLDINPLWIGVAAILLFLVTWAAVRVNERASSWRLWFCYFSARLQTGYGPIRLQLLPDGTITVSVYSKGGWVPVIAEFREPSECTIDHSVSEIEIMANLKRPYYFEDESDSGPYYRRRHMTRRRNPR